MGLWKYVYLGLLKGLLIVILSMLTMGCCHLGFMRSARNQTPFLVFHAALWLIIILNDDWPIIATSMSLFSFTSMVGVCFEVDCCMKVDDGSLWPDFLCLLIPYAPAAPLTNTSRDLALLHVLAQSNHISTAAVPSATGIPTLERLAPTPPAEQPAGLVEDSPALSEQLTDLAEESPPNPTVEQLTDLTVEPLGLVMQPTGSSL